MVHVAAIVLPGVFMASLAPLIDCFWLAGHRHRRLMDAEGRHAADLRLSLLSPDGADVPLDGHATMRIDGAVARSDRFDMVWLPGFRVGDTAALRARLDGLGALIGWLTEAGARGTTIAASGAAVTLPMAAGLADQTAIPVAPALATVLRGLFPRYRQSAEARIVDRDGLLLSPGIAQDFDMAVLAFTRLLSPETGRWLRSVAGGASAQDPPALIDHDSLVAAARWRLEQDFTGPVSLAALASDLAVTQAVLIRRFRKTLGMTPSAYLAKLRLAAAQRMLISSDRSIESIAFTLGYSDPRLFRQMFRRATGQSASAWRAAHRQA